ncbi:MAG: DUF6607 family protein [Pseudomonadota bacterium]
MDIRLILGTIIALLLTGCATTTAPSTETEARTPVYDYAQVANPFFERIATTASERERDRLAILAMQGDYRVDFHFQETVPLAAGYERRADKTTGGFETVFVVENEPGKVVLQHLLVMPSGHVIKHWRQDWQFEATHRFEYVAEQTWESRALDPEATRGMWTQCVYEVSDAPRYCGSGKWNHRYGVSTWTSDRTWRPLPRREYTIRDDYNALNAENRHTITANGWTHEQDNTKTVREGQATRATLVREFGFNDYRNIDGYDFAPAVAYWARTSDYWTRVREAWSRRLAPGARLVIDTAIDGMPIIEGTFSQAESITQMSASEQYEAIEALLSAHTRVEQKVSALK